ncbi:MAG: PTS sugar transporter subunit IIA [bacterium]
MVGVIVVTHGSLGKALVETAENIIGPQKNLRFAGIETGEGLEDLREKIHREVDEVDDGSGVVLLTDIFGGSSTNVGLLLQRDHRMEIVAGVNLPMVLELLAVNENTTLQEAARLFQEKGKKGIVNVGEIIEKRRRKA